MAITINKVAGPVGVTERRYIYKDVHIDLAQDIAPSGDSLYSKSTTYDIKADLDEAAVTNSIRNIFTTKPGEKLLNPQFGADLSQWVFEPADEFSARELGEAIVTSIERFEPRVKVDHIHVNANPSRNEFMIKLVLTIPSLNIINKDYTAILNQPGFDFLTNTNT